MIEIEDDEVERALIKVNKNKAIGIDNLSFKPLNKQNISKMKIKGLNHIETKHQEKVSKKQWENRIIEPIA